MKEILKFILECPEWFAPKSLWGVAQVVRLVPMVLLVALGGWILVDACIDSQGRTDAILLGFLCLEAGLLILGIAHLAMWLLAWSAGLFKGHKPSITARTVTEPTAISA